ncbi:MAG: alanine racemase [Firmicutes bacterium]|nr:alanine racemase [Bacillota bacterium]
MRPTIAEIDLAAIRHNVRQIQAAIDPATKIFCAVKANAYGHGAIKVTQAVLAAGATGLLVAIPEEGAELRAADITAPILVLGLILPEDAEFIVRNKLIATVCTHAGLEALDAAARRQNVYAQVMLKVDTGMSRIGIKPNCVDEYLNHIATLSHLHLSGAFTHLATADAADKTYALMQLNSFNAISGKLPEGSYLSAANSATIIDLASAHSNLVRPGIIVYGLPPSAEMHNSLDLHPAMQLKTRIVFIKEAAPGTLVSYGSTYHTTRQTYLATLPIGYADGYSRLLSNKAHVLIGGKKRPVVGRVCMDQIIVDLGPTCDAAIGDEAVLFGRQGDAEITVTELADLVGTINYELVCAISSRVPRVYLNE